MNAGWDGAGPPPLNPLVSPAISLRSCYAMSGTGIAYDSLSCCALSRTDIAYDITRSRPNSRRGRRPIWGGWGNEHRPAVHLSLIHI
eukprot:560970-Rhodomonas_salina.1